MLKKYIAQLLFMLALSSCATIDSPGWMFTKEGTVDSPLLVQTTLISLDADGLTARFTVANKGDLPICLGPMRSFDGLSISYVSWYYRRIGDGANFGLGGTVDETADRKDLKLTTKNLLIVPSGETAGFVMSAQWDEPRPELTGVIAGVPAGDFRPYRTGDKLILILAVFPNRCPSESDEGPNPRYAIESSNSDPFLLP
jgi:hypothetical protein